MKRILHCIRLLAVAAIAAAALGGCAGGPVPMRDVLPGEIFAPHGDATAPEQVARLAFGAGYVLVGEGHSVACGHRVQADVLAALVRSGLTPTLGLEMVSVDMQPVLDRFNAGDIGVDELEAALDWKKNWGHPYAGYASVLRTARRLGVPVAALNVPRRVVRAVSKDGLDGVAPEDRPLLPAAVIPPGDEQREVLRVEFERHQGMMGDRDVDDEVDRFMLVQSLWDTAMAENAVRLRKRQGDPVVVLAGSGHVEFGWGVEHRLRQLDPGIGILSVLPWRGLEDVDSDAADLFFYCARTHSSRMGFTLKLLPDAAEVLAVAPGTKAETAGFQAGDRIVEAQGLPVDDLWVLHKAAVQAGKSEVPLAFTVLRGDERLTLSIPLSQRRDAEPAPAAPDTQ